MPITKMDFDTGSPLLNGLNMYNSAAGMAKGVSKLAGGAADAGGNAMSRRLETFGPDELDAANSDIGSAHDMLNDPNHDMPYEDRELFMKPILMAKHGLTEEPQQKQSQGQIEKMGDSGGPGKALQLASTIAMLV